MFDQTERTENLHDIAPIKETILFQRTRQMVIEFLLFSLFISANIIAAANRRTSIMTCLALIVSCLFKHKVKIENEAFRSVFFDVVTPKCAICMDEEVC